MSILGLAMKITADASGLQKSLTPVDRALQRLGEQASASASLFEKFVGSTSGASAAQRQVATDIAFLTSALKTGQVSAQEFADEFAKIQAAARATADAFAEGARITEATLTAEERRAAKLQELDGLLKQNAFSTEAYARALAGLGAGFDGTSSDRFSAAIAVLQKEMQAGATSLEAFQRQATNVARAVESSTPASQRSAEAILALKARLDAGKISLEEYRNQFAQIRSGDFSSTFTVKVAGVREGVQATDELRQSIASLTDKQIRAVLQLSGVSTLDDLRAKLDGINGKRVDAILEILGVKSVDEARARLLSLGDVRVEPQLKTVGFDSIDQARKALASLQDREVAATLKFFGTGSIEAAKKQLAELDGTSVRALVEASGFESIDKAKAKFAELQDVNVQATLELLGVKSIDEAAKRLEQLGNSSVNVNAQLEAAGFENIDQARKALEALQDKNITAAAKVVGADSLSQFLSLVNAIDVKEINVPTSSNADETAAKLRALVEEQDNYQRLLADAQKLNEAAATSQARQAAEMQRLEAVYGTGKLTLQAYNAEAIRILGINEQVSRSEQERASFAARAAQLQEQARSPMQRYDAEVQELFAHLNAFNLTQQEFNTLLADATQRFARAESAAKGYDSAVEQAGKKGNLAFNELAGTLAVLPGPIGNVAGRLSGISSAAEGLNRIFSNGGGIGQFGAAIAGLVNPTTLALGGLAAFGAGAVAVGRGLVQLEGEVERLGQLAERLGVSFGFIQVLETAANQTGTSVESLGGSFTKFLRSVDEARDGGKNAAAAFKTLGLSTEDVRNADPETLFTQSADAIARIADPAKRAATAVALFGKSGAELLPVFRQLGAAAADLERIGGALTDQQRAEIDAFGDSLDRLGVASQGLKRQLTANFAGFGKIVADNTAEAIGGLNRFIRQLDDVANDKTWLGFQKSADRLKFDREIIASREQVAKSLQEGRTNAAIAELVNSLGLAGDGTIRLSGDLEKAQAQAAALGNDGTQAFLAFVKSLEDVAAAAEGAGLSEEQLARAVAASRQDFEKNIEALGREADAQRQAADAATKAAEDRVRAAERVAEADRQRADAFMRQAGIGQENEAAANLLAITRQIDEAETAIVQARAKGDADAEKAALRRLQILDQAQAAAQDTLDFGFNANDIQQAIKGAQDELDAVIAKAGEFGQAGVQAALQFQDGLAKAKAQLEGDVINPDVFNEAIQKQQQLFNDRIKRLEEIRNLELQIIEERASVEEDRLAALRRVSQEPLQVNDIRTQEGASELVRLATGREDPAIEEYRKQLDQLRKLEAKLDKLAAAPVEILGA